VFSLTLLSESFSFPFDADQNTERSYMLDCFLTHGEEPMKRLLILTAATAYVMCGCATLTNDAMIPVAFSFSDGSRGECVMTNKRGKWTVTVPSTADIRRSDDSLLFECTSEHGGKAVGAVPSTMGGEIAMSAIFLDFGITDAITDKHRYYPASFVIPMTASSPTQGPQERFMKQVKQIAESMDCQSGARLLSASDESEKWVLDCGDGEVIEVRCFEERCYTN
jgi:hypothetical protein